MAQLPNSGISISMVKNTLGENHIDVGSLCASDKVNMWSLWKPVSSSTVTMNANLLKSLHYGITLPHENSASYTVAQLASAIYNCIDNDLDVNSVTKWTYNKPVGGQQSPYRLGDFRNYQHNAILPFDYNNPDHPIESFDVSRLGSLYEWTTSVLQDNQLVGGITGYEIGDLYPESLHYGAMLLDVDYYIEHGGHDSTRSYNGIYFVAANEGFIEDDELYIYIKGTPTAFTSSQYFYVPFIAYFTGSTSSDLWNFKGMIPSSSNWSTIVSALGKVFPLPDGIKQIQIIAASEPNPVLIQAGYGYSGMMWSQLTNYAYYNTSTSYVNTVANEYFQLTDFNISKIQFTRTDTYTSGPLRWNLDFFVGANINTPGCVFFVTDMDSDPYYLKMELNTNKQLTGFTWNMNGNESAITLSTPFTLPTTSGSSCRILIESNASQRMTFKFYQTKSSANPLITADLGYVYTQNQPDTISIGAANASVGGLMDFFITGIELKVQN